MTIQLRMEPHLWGSFIEFLKAHKYEVVKSCSTKQPYIINHVETPELSHFIELKHGLWIIPLGLYFKALEFYKSNKPEKEILIQICDYCMYEFCLIEHNWCCPKCSTSNVPF
ncbi:hypothetical protein C9J47_05490 [Photobacterium indicum]|uniref:Uncharacterized protein n=1 Tax=Photobacterium indicum TaxID=81447 RepID=A0A2T3LF43_9GAMM|nr:hypothetical protein C9J47_05490 [Photobacterium indicum]